ncbi:SH3-like domain-containing protein [Candidatus Bandiella woodruffii]|uniref:SH3-like domain-containing protein n=2 Tax=Candidatus Bandiella euplotis TaxID=1664265 RepID=A0ABZ0UM35_9RICK|nr:SH3-like domain-containing protein [Candidatus Bandiella woodruffii]
MQINKTTIFLICCIFTLIAISCNAAELGQVTGLPINRYVSLKSDEIKLRVGPGQKYQTSYIYQCKNCPVKIIAEFDNWRKIQDKDGTQGWVHQSLLSGVNYAIIKDNKLAANSILKKEITNNHSLIFKAPNEGSSPIAKVEFDTIVKVRKCENEWCRVDAGNYTGWIQKINLWGVE